MRPELKEPSLTSAVKGGTVALTGNIFQYLSRLVLGLALARSLGADQFGLYTLTLTVVSLAGGIALLGLPQSLTRFISRSPGEEGRIWGILLFGIGVPTLWGACLGLGLVVIAPSLALNLFERPELEIPLITAALALPFFALNRTGCFAALGFGRVHYRVIAEDVFRHSLKLILVILVGLVGLTVFRAVVIEVFSLMMSCLVILWLLNRAFSLRRPIAKATVPARALISFSVPLYVREFVRILVQSVPLLLLGTFAPVASVGMLSVASRIVGASRLGHSAISQASMPVISALAGQGNLEKLGRYYVSLSQWSLMLYLPLFFGLLFLSKEVLTVFGDRFADAATALALLAAGHLVNVSTGICGVVLTMTGRVWTGLINSLLKLSLIVGLSWTLVPPFGLMGAATAITISIALTNTIIALEVYLYYRILPVDGRTGQLFLAAGFAFGAATGLARIILGEWTGSILAYTLGLLAYTGLLWLRGLSGEERRVLETIKGSFRRKMAWIDPS